jgi:hypothetical protein
MERVSEKEIVRFNTKWVEGNRCYLWQGYLDRDGYGSFYFRKKLRRAHRVSYFMFVGDIPKGMVVDHICNNRNCVNPSHLRLLTPKENALDSRSIPAQNARKTHCPKGHPYDKFYGQRYCSICEAEKHKRLHLKWNAQDTVPC